jgi:4-hydroxybenzoate polyprenyltransferase
VFLPVIFGQRIFDADAWLNGLKMFITFCVAASSVYFWNDVADAESDQLHPVKRLRPIASGALAASTATAISAAGMALALIGGYGLSVWFGHVIALYIGLNVIYTKWFRDFVIVDVFCISFFFVLRVIAGPLVLQIPVSYWMIILTALLSLFMALNKRRFELVRLARRAQEHREVLEKYSAYFIDQMCAAITAAILVVYMLYTLDPRQVERFGSHNLVYSIPFVWYGVFRYQYLVFKKGHGGDPAAIVLSDRFMLLNVLLWVIVCAFAIYARREWVPFVIA